MVLVVWTGDVDLVAARVPALPPPHDTGNNDRNTLPRDPDGNLAEIVAQHSSWVCNWLTAKITKWGAPWCGDRGIDISIPGA
ncbi:MAG TPA: hypothetical protein VKS82_00720 [Streptosporangiaceae bacterium]|nr:hypothetical protein [Streptosporangiaceae bacterium]